MDETPLEANPQFTPAPKRKINKRFLYLIAAILLILLLVVGYKLFGASSNSSQNTNLTPTPTEALIPTDTPTPTPEESPTPTVTPIPTPKPTVNPVDKTTGLNRSKLSVTVENGSGEAGVAGKGSDYLKGLGYDVISTGNADNYNYTGVTIQVKSVDSDYLSLLRKDLEVNYSVTSATSDLSASNSADALVIIGK